MSRKDKESKKKADDPGSTPDSSDAVRTSGWDERAPRPRWRPFPVPGRMDLPLRITTTREVYADLVAHTKSNLEAEVCGVLIGQTCEDDAGLYVAIDGMIQGASSREGGAHVTFTQETWTHIHEVKDRDFAKKQIVGWYHSHPGFGVEFSEMDTFIQKNFFSGPAQIALVIDPVSGEEALLANTDRGTEYVERFWIDGREPKATCPARSGSGSSGGTGGGDPGGGGGSGGGATTAAAIEALERRLGQVIQAVEDQRNFQYNVWMFIGMLVGLVILMYAGFYIYDSVWKPPQPPANVSWMQGTVRIGDNFYKVGVPQIEWQLPPDLQVRMLTDLAKALKEQEDAQKKAEAEAHGGAATQRANPPAGTQPK